MKIHSFLNIAFHDFSPYYSIGVIIPQQHKKLKGEHPKFRIFTLLFLCFYASGLLLVVDFKFQKVRSGIMSTGIKLHPASGNFIRIYVRIYYGFLFPNRLIHIMPIRIYYAATSRKRYLRKFGIFFRAVKPFRVHILCNIRICMKNITVIFNGYMLDCIMPFTVVICIRRQIQSNASFIQGHSCQRHIVFPTDESSHLSPFCIGDGKMLIGIVSVRPDKSLRPCGLDFTMMSNYFSLR